jgi:hypothetical protein
MNFAVAGVAGAGPDHERLAKFRGKPCSAGLKAQNGWPERLEHAQVQQPKIFWIFLCRRSRNFVALISLRESP